MLDRSYYNQPDDTGGTMGEDERLEGKDKASDEKYPWHLLIRTILVLQAFLALGINDAIQGPTLLDLRDLVDAKISEISFIFMLGSIGSLIGCFLMGVILDRLSRYRYLILASTLIVMGVANGSLPYCPSLLAMYATAFIRGLGSGSLDTGGNVLVLDIWKGRDSGPYMHAAHFCFGVGAFLAPVISKPFLVNVAEFEHHTVENETELENTTVESLEVQNMLESSTWTIKALYPMAGSYALIISLGFLFYFIKDISKKDREETEKDETKKNKTEKEDLSRRLKLVTVGLVAVFFFLYVGMEVAFGTFISVFTVESELKFTRPQGSDVTAVFWGTFAATRGLAIFIAIIAKPGVIMWGSFITCIAGSLLLSSMAQTSIMIIYTGTAMMGVGMASIFATGFLWVEQRMAVTNKVGSVFVIASSAGADVFPVLVGQLVETWPMALMYLTLSIVCSCVLMFSIISLVAARGGINPGQNITQESIELKEEQRTSF